MRRYNDTCSQSDWMLSRCLELAGVEANTEHACGACGLDVRDPESRPRLAARLRDQCVGCLGVRSTSSGSVIICILFFKRNDSDFNTYSDMIEFEDNIIRNKFLDCRRGTYYFSLYSKPSQ